MSPTPQLHPKTLTKISRHTQAAICKGAPAHPVDATPACVRPTRLDQLVVEAVRLTVRSDGTCEFADYHGVDLCALTDEVLAYSVKRLGSRFGQGNQQRLLGALLNYRNHFAPDANWHAEATDVRDATITWRCHTVNLPTVTDTITRTSRLAELSLRPALTPSIQGVVRTCDLTNPKESLLWFPDENATVAWCVADDPIRMRELAFPHWEAPPAAGSTNGGRAVSGTWTK